MNINEAAKSFFTREDIREQAVNDLSEIIAIPSVAVDADGIYPYGKDCAKALDKAAELANKYGFTVENHDYHCLSILYGDSDKEVGIVCHLDVVPAGDGWTVEPYKLTICDNLLMGRGTHDDKGPFIQALYTLRFFKENGIKLPFTIRLYCGSDEEVGCTDLEHYLSVRKAPLFSFTPDSEFPVCIGEKSILSVDTEFCCLPESVKEIKGGTVSNAVPGSAYALIDTDKALNNTESITVSKTENGTKIEAVGKSAHAAMPESGINAIGVLFAYLLENGIVEGEVFEFLKNADGEYLGKTLGIDAENEAFGYLTCVGSVISSEGNKIKQTFNIRHLPETPDVDVCEAIQKTVKPFGGIATMTSTSCGYSMSADDDKIKALTKACEEVLGYECKPYTTGGGTYARWMPNTVAFGSAIPEERNYLGDERGNAHQRDEYMTKREFFDGMLIYSKALGNISEIL